MKKLRPEERRGKVSLTLDKKTVGNLQRASRQTLIPQSRIVERSLQRYFDHLWKKEPSLSAPQSPPSQS